MHHSRITEEDERSSISLHDHTLIQVYDQLDYSDEEHNDSSSQDRSLSLSRQQELAHITQIQQLNDSRMHRHQRLHSYHQPHAFQQQRRRFSDLENKYDLGVSPSTKEEYSILKANEHQQRISLPMRIEQRSNLPQTNNFCDEQIKPSKQRIVYQEQSNSQESLPSGRKANLGRMKQKKNFDIDSFLNAEPVGPKNKKGVNVLSRIEDVRDKANLNKRRYALSPSRVIEQEESISLITLPEKEAVERERLEAMIQRSQEQLGGLKACQRRLEQAKLNFLDCFLPEPLKIKKNPYNLLKYINNRIRI